MANVPAYVNLWTDVLRLPAEVYEQMTSYNDERGPARTAARLRNTADRKGFNVLAQAAGRVASTFDRVTDKSLGATSNKVPVDPELSYQADKVIAIESLTLRDALRPEGIDFPTELQVRVTNDNQHPPVIRLRRKNGPDLEVPLGNDVLELYRSRSEWDVDRPRRG